MTVNGFISDLRLDGSCLHSAEFSRRYGYA